MLKKIRHFFANLLLFLFVANLPAFGNDLFIVDDIQIRGLKQISPGMVFNYLPVTIGDTMDENRIRKAVRALFKTGFFRDVRLERDGDVLVVTVEERPTIALITFDGNRAIKTEDLEDGLAEAGFSEGEVFNQGKLDKVIQELRRQYYANGKYGAQVDYEISPVGEDAIEIAFLIVEGEAAKIKQIKIVGNTVYSDEELLNVFKLKTGNWLSWFRKDDQYSKQKLSGDLETLRSWYQDYGYLNFSIDSTQVSVSPDKESVYVTINITEGDSFVIDKVLLSGTLIIEPIELYGFVFTRKGDVFSRKMVEATSKAISDRLGHEGYAFANVNPIPEVDKESRTAELTYYIDPGQRVYVRRINFYGNRKTRDEVLRREMRQMEGGWISTPKVERSKIRLKRTGYFEEAVVETPAVPGSTDLVDVNFMVEERPSGNLMLGAGFSQGAGLIFNTQVSQDNFMGSGKSVNFTFNNSEINKSFRLGYFNPYWTIDGVARGFDLSYSEIEAGRRRIARYDQKNVSVGASFGIPFTEFNYMNIGINWERSEIQTDQFLLDPIIATFLAREGREYDNFRLQTSFSYDTRNAGLFPNSGTLQRISTEIALPGGDLYYWKVDYDSRYYFKIPFKRNFTGLLKSKVGYGDSYGSTTELPFFRNFYAGGPRTVRGYDESSLGPQDIFGRALGGNIMFVGNAEMILPLPIQELKSTRLSLFYDVGNVFASNESFSFSDMRMSVGVSGIWMSPFGLLSVSYSKPFNDQFGDEIQKFQFNFGTQF